MSYKYFYYPYCQNGVWRYQWGKWYVPPSPVTNLRWRIVKIMGKKAVLALDWKKSVSTDVVEQRISVKIGDGPVTEFKVQGSVETLQVGAVAELTNVTAEHRAFDGVNLSDPVAASYNTGDLTKPAPATEFGFRVVEIIDVPDEEPIVE